jgi:glycosyltransferase involved in cell wall biosynthesis
MNEMKLSVVLPCYNESGNLPNLLEAYNKVINRNDIEIIVVNNGSTDETANVLRDIHHKHFFLRVVHVEKNAGYGNGIITGLKEARGKYIGWSHGDLQTPPEDVIKALEIIEKNNLHNVLVKGKRYGRPFADVFFTFGMSIFETVLFGKVLYDINAQPNIFPKEFFESWVQPPLDFSLDLYCLHLAKTKGMKVIRFPVEFRKRGAGVSSWNVGWKSKWKFIKRTLDFSFRLRFA